MSTLVAGCVFSHCVHKSQYTTADGKVNQKIYTVDENRTRNSRD